MSNLSAAALLHLLQLVSPALPVGAYSYSQGLEWAIEIGTVQDEADAKRWIADLWRHGMARLELPLLARLLAAWSLADVASVQRLNDWLLASRETRELYAETAQMGYSLVRLIDDLALGDAVSRTSLLAMDEVAFPTAWAYAAVELRIDARHAVLAYSYAWLENQVMAALKAVPLGQLAGQRLLLALGSMVEQYADDIVLLGDEALGAWLPGLAIASSLHETQYSRLFRS